MNLEELKYPIGGFSPPKIKDEAFKLAAIESIERFPAEVRKEVGGLDEAGIQWIYRPDGWTINQVVHHCVESHMNAVIRFKLALSEDNPTIKPYLEDKWAQMDDYRLPIENSVILLEYLHIKWVHILRSINDADWDRRFTHPEMGKSIRLITNLALYAWHCEHHLAHIKQAKKYRGEF